jgi:DnaK suppressor protein
MEDAMTAHFTAAGSKHRKRELTHFQRILEEQREELLRVAQRAATGEVQLDPDDFPDEIDAASAEIELALIGRLRARERGLLNKIHLALERLENGTFGECADCGEEIDIRRLEARPVAELCIDCKSRQERIERSVM